MANDSQAIASPSEPPYAADTRAKGWRFELDLERIEQSDTWALAPAELRPWLLMLWATAWKQVPCGSLPDDDQLIAVRIGMKAAQFAKSRSILMRGWWKAVDGRLYHPTMTTRVLEMMGVKDKERQRKAEYRKRKDAEEAARQNGDGRGSDPGQGAEVPDLSHGTAEGQNRDGQGSDPGKDDTGTGTGTGTGLLNTPLPPKGGRGSGPTPDPFGFAEFWAAYPRKIGKDAARKAFAKRKPDGDLLSEMLAAIRVQTQSEQWCKDGGQFIPHPSTWLTQGRWGDEVPGKVNDTENKPQWAINAGFANRWEAQNEGCTERNAHQFSCGKRRELVL